MKSLFPLVVAAILLSCSPAVNDATDTGLQGKVLRGPITPVCKDNEPCDAPFSAEFIVLKNARKVGRFKSDSQGEFAIALEPGLYIIVPDSSAPLMAPPQQQKEVEVQPEGMTPVTLYFDTGIR
jgi:hypothetical protein